MEKIYGKHRPLTDEMIQDLSKMCDQDFMAKWNTSRQYPIRARKRLGIKSFTNQHGTIDHKFENNIEYKWCGTGHWEIVSNFGKHSSRNDGLRAWCKSCVHKKESEYYDKNDGAKRRRNWYKTEKGKKSKASTMRKVWMKRRSYYIKFDLEDEERIYELCNRSCAYCKTPVSFDELEFDHFIPVKLGGMTEPNNMLPSCPKCNRGRGGKFDKHPVEWLPQKFGEHFGNMIYKECIQILSSLSNDMELQSVAGVKNYGNQ